MVKKQIPCFNLAQICRSGQCFRMYETDAGHFSLIAGQRRLEMEQAEDGCTFYCSEEEFANIWNYYFDLDGDYEGYIGKINPRDAYLISASEFGKGIRILRQDLWEMMVSFLISQQNNILRIRRCIENICQVYGEERVDGFAGCLSKEQTGMGPCEGIGEGKRFYGFPTPEALAVLDDDALMACNLGYRSKYVVRAARDVAFGQVDLEAIKKMPYRKAREELLKIYGVGEKVADCICLFALHHLQEFPVDTHINHALKRHYKRGFPNRRYQGIRGVMQQYIFYYELEALRK